MKIITTYPSNRYIGPILSFERFTFKAKTFIAEASDFRGDRFMGQLYDDACDMGLILLNPTTMQQVPFCLTRDERDGENELIAYHFVVCPEAVRRNPALAGLKI